MRKFLSRYFPIIPVVLLLGSMIFSHSCANTTQAPTGGAKDTIPPVIVKIYPPNGSSLIPVEGAKFSFTFDEYVTVKNPQNIFLSPPQKKSPKYKLRGKSVEISFEEPLDSNTTYTLEFTDAIADNNEGNLFPGFTYVFSTGSSIDSMMVTGVVQDCNTLSPVKGITVMAYKDHSDSAVVLSRPDMATKTDDWGFFCLRNLQDTLYRIYAVKDANNNNRYDPDENELIAFLDSAIVPRTKINDSLPELQKFDMKDTVGCLSRKNELELSLFRAKPSKQLIVNTVRVSDRSSYITFMAQNAHVDSMWIAGLSPSRLITQFNIERDSLEIWVNDRKKAPDTLHLYVNYRKTDSLGHLNSETEHVKLFMEGVGKTTSRSSRRDIKHEDTICVYTLNAEPETVEQKGFELEFKYPIINETFDSLKLKAINPKQIESAAKFKVIPDSLNIRKFRIMPTDRLLVGYEYVLKMPYRSFRDINGYYNDSTEVSVKLPTDEKLSTLTFVARGVHKKYIVDLLNEKRDNVLRSYVIDSDSELVFPYLKAGKYSIRITEDVNRNSIVDTGSLFDHRQPEKVKFFKIGDDSYLDIPEMTEIQQTVDLAALFDGIVTETPETVTEDLNEAAESVVEEANEVREAVTAGETVESAANNIMTNE